MGPARRNIRDQLTLNQQQNNQSMRGTHKEGHNDEQEF